METALARPDQLADPNSGITVLNWEIIQERYGGGTASVHLRAVGEVQYGLMTYINTALGRFGRIVLPANIDGQRMLFTVYGIMVGYNIDHYSPKGVEDFTEAKLQFSWRPYHEQAENFPALEAVQPALPAE